MLCRAGAEVRATSQTARMNRRDFTAVWILISTYRQSTECNLLAGWADMQSPICADVDTSAGGTKNIGSVTNPE